MVSWPSNKAVADVVCLLVEEVAVADEDRVDLCNRDGDHKEGNPSNLTTRQGTQEDNREVCLLVGFSKDHPRNKHHCLTRVH